MEEIENHSQRRVYLRLLVSLSILVTLVISVLVLPLLWPLYP